MSTYILHIYKHYEYHNAGFSTISQHLNKIGDLNNFYTHINTVFLKSFFLYLTFLNTFWEQSPGTLLHMKLFLYSFMQAWQVMSDPHNKHSLHCTVQYYYRFIKGGLTTVLLHQNTWPLLNTKRCSV